MKIPNSVTKIDKRGLSHEQWLRARNNFIGASEVGTILGLNDYESTLEMFHRKVSVIDSFKPEQLSTYSGHCLEPVIYEKYWKFYDPSNPTHERLVENAVARNVMRTARRVNFTLVSKEYPWLSCSLDYAMDPNRFTEPGPLDCKASLSWVSRMYEGDVHPGYLAQMTSQMLITGWQYSELGFLLDGRYPSFIPVPRHIGIEDAIIKETKKFWEMVLEGRKIWQRTDLSESDRLQNLVQFEPEITGSHALEDYLKERYKSNYKAGRMVGTPEILECAIRYLKCTEEINGIDTKKTLEGNMLRKLFLDAKIDEIMFPDDKNKQKALISYRSLEGKPAVLRVSKELLKLV